MRKAEIDFPDKRATVTVVSSAYDPAALTEALESAGFGGSVVATQGDDSKSKVTFHVLGMKKTKSGAT